MSLDAYHNAMLGEVRRLTARNMAEIEELPQRIEFVLGRLQQFAEMERALVAAGAIEPERTPAGEGESALTGMVLAPHRMVSLALGHPPPRSLLGTDLVQVLTGVADRVRGMLARTTGDA